MFIDYDLKKLQGLSEAEAARRLEAEGPNELPSSKKRSTLAIAWEVVREPMFLLLVAGGSLYFFLGDIQEGLMLLGFVFVVMGITLYQERKTARALEALRDLSSPRALVIRDGQQRRIPGREVARDDLVILSEGDRVPADGWVIYGHNLLAEESLLTGESVPVRKQAVTEVKEMLPPGGDDLPAVFSGTLIVQGQGVAQILKTGLETEMGRIGKELARVESEDTPLQKETDHLVRNIALVGLGLCLLAVVGYGLTRGDWLNGLLAGITLAMAILPEEFPVVLTIFLAMGAWRISKKNVLTRRIPAVETLGSATVLCVDKTGTLTQNKMAVGKIMANGQVFDPAQTKAGFLPENFHELVEFAILASQKNPFDPMERSLNDFGVQYLARTEHLHDDWTLVQEYPLSKELLALSHVWQSPSGQDYVIAAKGAPEAIADLCHFEPFQAENLDQQARALAAEGYRVIAAAKAHFQKQALPGGQHDFNFQFLGLIALADPIRPQVPDSVRQCYRAGLRIIMITGDYPETARQIARQIGLSSPDRIVTGSELRRMSDRQLEEAVKEANIFARVVPEQKLRLVKALKAGGQIVAMTGDGVNDAPALKAAHIGIAMGERGTDVARESAELILTDDDFSSIVQAVRLGRRIFDNLKKAMAYIFAVHVPIAGISLLPALLGWPLVLLPVHIVFLELIIDPACSIVFEVEPEERTVMDRPPRPISEPLFGWPTIKLCLFQGLCVLLAILVVFLATLNFGLGEAEARTMTFVTLILANLCLILTNRSWSRTIWQSLGTRNRAMWAVSGAALAFLLAAIYLPWGREVFRFAVIDTRDWLICLGAALFSIGGFEMLKVFDKKDGFPLPRE